MLSGNSDTMDIKQSIVAGLIGNPAHRRLAYVVVAWGLAVLVAVGIPAAWIDGDIWMFAVLGGLIAVVGGAGRYGLVSGFLGTALYIAVIGKRAFLLSAGGQYPVRLLALLAIGTVAVVLPAYLIGASVRRIAIGESRVSARS